MQALADEVGRKRLHAGQRTEPALQDDDLFVTIHALDAEHRFRVDLAVRADRRPRLSPSVLGPAAVLLDVAQALAEQRQNMLVVKGIEDHPTLTP